jgi:hypothetical protein
VLHRKLIHEALIANQLLEHVTRRRRDAAVVEIDHGAVAVERALDQSPVLFVFGHRERGTVAGDRVGLEDLAECVLPHDRQCHAGSSQPFHERATGRHVVLKE